LPSDSNLAAWPQSSCKAMTSLSQYYYLYK
jgi:hypothetical protein